MASAFGAGYPPGMTVADPTYRQHLRPPPMHPMLDRMGHVDNLAVQRDTGRSSRHTVLMEPVPLSVFEAAVAVAGGALHWKSSLRQIFRSSGLSENACNRYDSLSKYQAMRTAWDELNGQGPKGRVVQHRLVRALANIDHPDPKCNQEMGSRAIVELRRLARQAEILVSPEDAARQQRRAAAKAAAQKRDSRRDRLAVLRRSFNDLHSEKNKQKRGYDFEKLLGDLFRLYELEYNGSYKTETDQVDGLVVFQSFTYLIEARWRDVAAVENDLAVLTSKAERRIDATRGLFISMAGYRDEVVRLYRMAKGSRLILVSGEDLAFVFEGRIELPDALADKERAAAQFGEPYHRLAAQ